MTPTRSPSPALAPSPSASSPASGPGALAAERLQTFQIAELVAAASGSVDLNALARRELAQRGLDQSGSWVGFDQAASALAEAERVSARGRSSRPAREGSRSRPAPSAGGPGL